MGKWFKYFILALKLQLLNGQNCWELENEWVEASNLSDQKWKGSFTIKLLNVNQNTIPTENYIAKLIKLEKSLEFITEHHIIIQLVNKLP